MNMVEGREVVGRGRGVPGAVEAVDDRVVTTRRGRSRAVVVTGEELAALEDAMELGVGSRLAA